MTFVSVANFYQHAERIYSLCRMDLQIVFLLNKLIIQLTNGLIVVSLFSVASNSLIAGWTSCYYVPM